MFPVIHRQGLWTALLYMMAPLAQRTECSSTASLGETLTSIKTVSQISARPTTTQLPSADHPLMRPPKPNGLESEHPNFIIFMPDQLRYDSVGYTGNDVWIPPSYV